MVKKGAEWGRTGDIAHLETGASISLFLRLVKTLCAGGMDPFPINPNFLINVLKLQVLFSVRPVWRRADRRVNRCPSKRVKGGYIT